MELMATVQPPALSRTARRYRVLCTLDSIRKISTGKATRFVSSKRLVMLLSPAQPEITCAICACSLRSLKTDCLRLRKKLAKKRPAICYQSAAFDCFKSAATSLQAIVRSEEHTSEIQSHS